MIYLIFASEIKYSHEKHGVYSIGIGYFISAKGKRRREFPVIILRISTVIMVFRPVT